MPGNAGPHPAPMRCRDSNQKSVSLERSALAKESRSNGYCPVPHLRAVNSAAVTIRPVVPEPYTLLSLLPAQASWFTCLDPKDAFFCLSPASQPLFAFEWEDPHTGRKKQLTWT